MQSETRYLLALLVVALGVFALTVWPRAQMYWTIETGNGTECIVQMNRFTGDTSIFCPGFENWDDLG